MGIERIAKAVTVLVLGLIGYLAATAGADVPLDQLEVVVFEIVTAFLVWLVPNKP